MTKHTTARQFILAHLQAAGGTMWSYEIDAAGLDWSEVEAMVQAGLVWASVPYSSGTMQYEIADKEGSRDESSY